MTDESKSLATNNTSENIKDDDSERSTQDRFEERWSLYMSEFSKMCNEHGVKVAIAVVQDPKLNPDELIVCARGHIYDQAEVLATMLRQLKQQIAKDLHA
jgi:hypothetical protein